MVAAIQWLRMQVLGMEVPGSNSGKVFFRHLKEIEAPVRHKKKKQRNQNETLNAHISQMAVANLIKFAVWRTLPGGQL